MTNRVAVLILVAVAGILALAACGPDSDNVPSLGDVEEVQAVEPAVSAGDKVLENEAKMMAFTQCLRDQGIEVLDPVVDADGNVEKPEFAEGEQVSKKDWGPIWDSCAVHLEGFAYEKERADMSELVDQLFAVTACLRDKGYDVDDPTAASLDQWKTSLTNALDFKDPEEEADYEECSREAGMGGRGK